MSQSVYVCGKHKYGDYETAPLAEMSLSDTVTDTEAVSLSPSISGFIG